MSQSYSNVHVTKGMHLSSTLQHWGCPLRCEEAACHVFVTTNWRDVTEEMKGVVAVVLNMGIIQLTDLKDYWNTDDYGGPEGRPCRMFSRDSRMFYHALRTFSRES